MSICKYFIFIYYLRSFFKISILVKLVKCLKEVYLNLFSVRFNFKKTFFFDKFGHLDKYYIENPKIPKKNI